MAHSLRTLLTFTSLLLLLAGGCGTSSDPDNGDTDTDFLSADPNGPRDVANGRGEADSEGGSAGTGAAAPSGDEGADARSVERGDIYKVLADHRLVNLNQYRGVQIIDVSNPDEPVLEGRLEVTGTPVEMYVVGDRAIVLINDWQGYYGDRDDVRVTAVQGGLVMNVDISDRSQPVLLGQAIVPGYIQTSRLTQGGSKAALYVAAQLYQVSSSDGTSVASVERTVIKSFDVSGSTLEEKSELDLGGYVQDIQATVDRMMVARYDYTVSNATSSVGIIDISSPDGTMVEGDDIKARGLVQNKFNMDIKGNVLRVVSGSQWSGTQTNHLETFDITDIANAKPLDTCTFGDGQQLYATLFVQNKAFFVTYLRQDPFHAFSIDDAGKCAEQSEFIVSGWNDFFRTVENETRLIGIGSNDEGEGTTLAVSLYDITDLTNKTPLLQRAEVSLSGSYSEASWDDRAFSIVEGAVSVDSKSGVEETGLVLLPFQGWDAANNAYVADVQLFTFSDRTLTQRGVMSHGSAVRRSFLTQPSVAANLSEDQLSLFATDDPNQPQELGRLDLAPNYKQVFVFGDYVARLEDRAYYWYGYGSNKTPLAAQVEIVRRSGDIDGGASLASFAVPSGSTLIQIGDLLASVSMIDVTNYDKVTNWNDLVPSYDTTIIVTDLSNPTAPKQRSTFNTKQLIPGYVGGGYYGGPYYAEGGATADCFDCGRGYGGYYNRNAGMFAVGESLVFAETSQEQKSLGNVESCYEYANGDSCAYSSDGTSKCPTTYVSGGIDCSTPQGGETLCSGGYYLCNRETGECDPTDKPKNVQRSCNTYEQFRYWTSYDFEVLDLRDPSAPKLAPTIELSESEEGNQVIAANDAIYFSYQKPVDIDNDPRPFVKHYFHKIDVSNPASPKVGAGINVPGDVIAADGNVVFTRDLVWNDTQTETMIARLTIEGGLAHLKAQHLFEQRAVNTVQLDGAGHILVSHDGVWTYYGRSAQNPVHKLTLLNESTLKTDGETEIDTWATFVTAKGGRAVFSVSGGVLVVNTEDAKNPHAQAYFPTNGYWSSDILLDGDEVIFAAGPYGIYRFDADTYNLLEK